MKNPLGNIISTLSDRKFAFDNDNNGEADYFAPQILTATDYYAFGSPMPGRSLSISDTGYRFGFNAQEKDNEITGIDGTHNEFEFREYDSRIGRFWKVDPLTKDYPWNSTYAFAENDVIRAIDLEGLERHIVITIGSDVEYRGSATVTQAQNYVTITHYHIKSTESVSQRFSEILKFESKLDTRGIASVMVFSHGSGQSIFAKQEEPDAIKNKLSYNQIPSLGGSGINYVKNATIYLGGCFSGDSEALKDKGLNVSYAQVMADVTKNTVIAGNSGIGPKNIETESTDLKYKANKFFSFNYGQEKKLIGSTVSVIDIILQSQRNYEVNSVSKMPVIKPSEITTNK